MRLLHANLVFSAVGGSFPGAKGSLLKIESTLLGSKLAKNPFEVGLSDATISTIQPVIPQSNIIGFVQRSNANSDSIAVAKTLNQELKFCKAQTIEYFDWSIQGLYNNITNAGELTAELVIAFYPACDCNPF